MAEDFRTDELDDVSCRLLVTPCIYEMPHRKTKNGMLDLIKREISSVGELADEQRQSCWKSLTNGQFTG